MQNKQGFTLVELSIVLVIIGLLIGGILAAQSMIGTAKIQGFIKQLQQNDTAIANFKTKFNSLPGDSKVFENPGDGNGRLDAYTCSLYPEGHCFVSELATFWEQLSQSGFDPKNVYTSVIPGGGFNSDPAALNVPISVLGKNKPSFIIYVFPSGNRIAYDVANFTVDDSTGYWAENDNPIRQPDALAVDAKLDDGVVDTGHVTATNYNGGWVPCDDINWDCYMMIDIHTNTNAGNPGEY